MTKLERDICSARLTHNFYNLKVLYVKQIRRTFATDAHECLAGRQLERPDRMSCSSLNITDI